MRLCKVGQAYDTLPCLSVLPPLPLYLSPLPLSLSRSLSPSPPSIPTLSPVPLSPPVSLPSVLPSLQVKNGSPQQRKASLRQLTDKAREFGAGPLFNQILPLLMSPTLEDQERHLLVKVSLVAGLPSLPLDTAVAHVPLTGGPGEASSGRGESGGGSTHSSTGHCCQVWDPPWETRRGTY